MKLLSTYRAPVRLRLRIAVLGLFLPLVLSACSVAASDEAVGVGITGIDHLADHLSVQNFWIDGYNAAQAGKGGRTVCCAMVPAQWRQGLKVNVRWNVTNWRDRSSQSFERDVAVDRYRETGQMFVHFLSDGSIRVLLSNYYPEGNRYPGPRDSIPRKFPWKQYPWSSDSAASAIK